MNKTPDISVAMMTYFHEKYVAQAIESVLNQKTRYTFELVISDDCSTDGTREIIERYQKQHPDIIRVNLNNNNIGISANHYNTRSLCKGRYIADIAGDDYWIDDNKLQKQIDFLEEHVEYIGTTTLFEVRVDGSTNRIELLPEKKYRGKAVSLDMYLHGVPLSTHGLVVRNQYLTDAGRNRYLLIPQASKYIDDSTECLLMLQDGPVFVMPFTSTVYRTHKEKLGRTNYNSVNTLFSHSQKMINLYNYIDSHINERIDLFNLYSFCVSRTLVYSITKGDFAHFSELYKTIPVEYRRRHLFIRSMPKIITFLWKSGKRRLKRKFQK